MALPGSDEGMQTVLFWGEDGPYFDELGLPYEKRGPIVGLDALEQKYREALRGDSGDTLCAEAELLAAETAAHLGSLGVENN